MTRAEKLKSRGNASLGYAELDSLEVTLATIMGNLINDDGVVSSV